MRQRNSAWQHDCTVRRLPASGLTLFQRLSGTYNCIMCVRITSLMKALPYFPPQLICLVSTGSLRLLYAVGYASRRLWMRNWIDVMCNVVRDLYRGDGGALLRLIGCCEYTLFEALLFLTVVWFNLALLSVLEYVNCVFWSIIGYIGVHILAWLLCCLT